MINTVTLITPPDDVYYDALRVLLVDLSRDQSQVITDALNQIDDIPTTVFYVWNSNDTVEWLIDKKHKSDLIVFNAESTNRELVGYMAAQHNSYYMGVLRTFEIINNRTITDVSVCVNIFENHIGNYVKR